MCAHDFLEVFNKEKIIINDAPIIILFVLVIC